MGGSDGRGSERADGDATPTKTGFAGQASENWRRRSAAWAGLGLAALWLGACRDVGGPAPACPPPARASGVSGLCVPRWVTLRLGAVNARRGPGSDYPALWVYHAQGLPVQIVAETRAWRRICDPDGLAAWVERASLDGRRAVAPLGASPVPILGGPRPDRPAKGLLAPHALARLDHCAAGWCEVRVSGVTGWASESLLWGVAGGAQCR
jgi:SH3-like domain-containing protein